MKYFKENIFFFFLFKTDLWQKLSIKGNLGQFTPSYFSLGKEEKKNISSSIDCISERDKVFKKDSDLPHKMLRFVRLTKSLRYFGVQHQ